MKTRNYLIATVAAAGLLALASTVGASSDRYSSKPWLSQMRAGEIRKLQTVFKVAEVIPQQSASKPWLVSQPTPVRETLSFEIAEAVPGRTTSKPWLNPSPQVPQFEIAPLK